MNEVSVVAVAKVKPEHEVRALELLRGVIEASHGCLTDRGARQTDARAVTMASRGIYRDAGRRSEALRLIPTHHSERSEPQWIFDDATDLGPLEEVLAAVAGS